MAKFVTRLGLAVLGAGLAAFSASPAFAGITFTLEGAGVQNTTVGLKR
jgi:hypothetical protein